VATSYTELAAGLYRVPHLGDFLNSFIVREDDGSVTLVDGGLTGGHKKILNALSELGLHREDVQRIVLTHAHADHAGGVTNLIRATSTEGAHAHVADAPFLAAGKAPPVNAGKFTAPVLNLVQKATFEPVPLAHPISDGEVLPVGGGMQVIHTPGHTPGHVSYLFLERGVLITGDCILNPLGRRIWPFGVFCVSPAQNAVSAARLADLEFDVAAFTHGPSITDRAREHIRDFLLRKNAIDR
jgi:glyoxylase-like metal-dependent hydrolase (beta-lactamase superfamily II)